jgi:hypothetical protein
MTTAEKYEAIKRQFKEWVSDHGTGVIWSALQVSEATGIPVAELFEYDNFTGLLTDLTDRGFLCVSIGAERHWAMDCSAWL